METSQLDADVRTVSASEFEDRCLSLIDEVVQTGDELIITQNGRPISRVTPYRTRRDGWFGINAGRITVHEDIVAPMPAEWFGTDRGLYEIVDDIVAPMPAEWFGESSD